MDFKYTVDFYHVLTGVHYMRTEFESDVHICNHMFEQELVNKVGMNDGWQQVPRHYVIVEFQHNTDIKRHHFNSMHFKGVTKEAKL